MPLFVFAETLLIPLTDQPESDPDTPPRGFIPPWQFRIVTNYPRKEIDLIEGESGAAVWEKVKQAGGALFVESREGAKWGERERREISGAESSDEEEVEG